MIFETKTIHAAIFDMDGTMFDTERLRMKMLKLASKRIFGESMSDEVLMDSLGVSAKTAEAIAQKKYGKDYPYQEIRKMADQLETEHVRTNGVPVKAGLFDVLERLKKNGVLLAVATSSRRSIVEEYLLNADVISYFDIIVCGDEVVHGKPNPEIFLKAAEELNCDPSRCLIFEDSEKGLLAAHRSGAIPIFVKDIREPRREIKDLAYRFYDNMIEFLDHLVPFTQKFPVPKLNESFPPRFNYYKVGIHGFGAIGGGYLTQVFSYWDGYTRPAEIVGATHNAVTREIVNSFGKFNVHYGNVAIDQIIDHVRLIDMADVSEMKKMYAESDLIGLSLPESAIKKQASLIARGLIERHKRSGKSLTVLVVLNRINGGAYVQYHVRNAVLKLAGSAMAQEIMAKTYFCESVVNRIVSKVPLEIQIRQVQMGLRSLNLYHDPVSFPTSKGHKGKRHQVPSISKSLRNLSRATQDFSDINITLFSSGTFMSLYAGKGNPLLERLRQVEVVDDIKKMQQLKNRLSNGPHAIAAWYSSLLGYATIGQGMGDQRVHAVIEKLMREEIKPAMLKIMPEASKYLDTFVDTFIQRCRSSFKDPCTRVGRDPLRKLQRQERIIGTIEVARSYGIKTELLEFGVAAGLLYGILCRDPKDKECQLMRDLYEKEKSIRDILLYHGEYNGKPYSCLDENETDLLERIEKDFETLKKEIETDRGRLE